MKTLMLILCCASLFLAQGNPAAPVSSQTTRSIGVILRIDPAARSLTIKTDAGPEMKISCSEVTQFLRVAPGAQTLDNAAAISASDLAVGDRILARGQNTSDSGLFAATSIIVMSRADIAKKHAAERAEWEKRGVSGVITALNPAAKEITINAAVSAKPMVIAFPPGAALRRYAANSVKFSDAQPSRYEELKVGDQIKALGTSNEDRSRYTAEELVSGSFRTIAATIVSSDPGQSIIIITDLATNKRLQAQVMPDSTVRRLSAEVAQILAARIQGGKPPAAPSSSTDGDRSPVSGGQSSPQQAPGDLQSAIEKLPPLSLAGLKPGDAIILSCTNSEDASRVTAITILAGVEPVLRSSSKGSRTLNLGSWNLDLNMNVGLP